MPIVRGVTSSLRHRFLVQVVLSVAGRELRFERRAPRVLSFLRRGGGGTSVPVFRGPEINRRRGRPVESAFKTIIDVRTPRGVDLRRQSASRSIRCSGGGGAPSMDRELRLFARFFVFFVELFLLGGVLYFFPPRSCFAAPFNWKGKRCARVAKWMSLVVLALWWGPAGIRPPLFGASRCGALYCVSWALPDFPSWLRLCLWTPVSWGG